jgi:hypothetical protein
LAHPSIKQPCDVLHDDEAGSKLANKAEVFKPKAGLLSREADLRSAFREVLTGKSADDAIDFNPVALEFGSGEFSHVMVAGNLRPMLSQHALAERIDLAERDGLEPARPLQAKVEAAYSGEEAEHAQGMLTDRPRP